jgi:hypothetical protein
MRLGIARGVLVLLAGSAFLMGCGGGTSIQSCPTSATFSFTPINVTGDTFTQLLGISNSAKIAGYHGSGADAQHPNQGFTVVPPATFTTENFPNSVQTQVIAINANGDTAGFYIDSAGVTHGFLDTGGTFATVDAPNTTFNQLLGLNNKGQAAGYSQDANGTQHPYIVQGTTFTAITTPGASAQATGINDNGDVSGFYVDSAGVSHGYVIPSGKALITVDFAMSTLTQALGLNNKGEVVGTYTDTATRMHGFIFNVSSAKFETIDETGGVGTTVVNGINDSGSIVGFFLDSTGNTEGFMGKVTGCM